MYIMSIYCQTNYGEEIPLKKIVTEAQLESYKTLAGREINFGEYCGKHSEVEGSYSLEDINVEEISDEVAKILIDNVGYHISGEDYFNHYYVADSHYEVFDFISEKMPQSLLGKVESFIMISEKIEKVSSYKRDEVIAELVSLATIIKLGEELEEEEDLEEIPSYFLEELSKALEVF